MAIEGGVIAIPASPFYSPPNKALGANYVRFAFCKGDETIIEATARIEKLLLAANEELPQVGEEEGVVVPAAAAPAGAHAE